MKLAFVGATGMVGREMLRQVEALHLNCEVVAFASEKSAGEELPFGGGTITVQALPAQWPQGIDYALMSAGGELSRRYAPQMAACGTVVIDNSSAWRQDPAVPLVVPEVNGGILRGARGIIANPNCSTIQLVHALAPLKPWGLKRVIVSTYQAVSGAGRRGVDALKAQEEGRDEPSPFPAPIHHNAIPHIGDLSDNDFTEEENKLNFEPQKILDLPDLQVRATAVRLPVPHGHSESVYVELERPLTASDLLKAWEAQLSLRYEEGVLTPLTHVQDSDTTFVSRLRLPSEREVMFWCVAHNLRVGAATNAARILHTHLTLNGGPA